MHGTTVKIPIRLLELFFARIRVNNELITLSMPADMHVEF